MQLTLVTIIALAAPTLAAPGAVWSCEARRHRCLDTTPVDQHRELCYSRFPYCVKECQTFRDSCNIAEGANHAVCAANYYQCVGEGPTNN